jgi:hypothetical protein
MIASLVTRAALAGFRRACRDPLAAQAGALRRILRDAAHTELGRRCGFEDLVALRDPVRLVQAYRERVPVRPFAAMRGELDAVYAGEWRGLCPSAPVFFALTAGSSGACKHVPMTPEFRGELSRGSLAYYGALEAAFPVLRGRRTQFLVGSAEGGVSPGGTPVGFASGFNYRHLPALLRRKFVLPYWIFTLDDAGERAYAIARLLVECRDLGALCAISPVNLLHVREALEPNRDRFLRDLERGTLTVSGRSAVPGHHAGRPNPALAVQLREAHARQGRFPNALLFPKLVVLVCWQGGNMGYDLPALREAYGVHDCHDFPLSASEGLFAIPLRPNVSGGVTAVHVHFLEFIPEEASDASDPPVLRADELAEGRSYRLVVTNSAGLYRYDMEDIVRVTGWFERTPVIEFISKKDRQVSVSNERIHEMDVTMAMEAASRATGTWVREFVFVPCSDRRYRVLLDGAAATGEPELRALEAELEKQLRRVATGYDFEREDALLAPLELFVTAPGELRAYLHRRLQASPLPNGQVKPLRLSNEFDLHRHFHAGALHAV